MRKSELQPDEVSAALQKNPEIHARIQNNIANHLTALDIITLCDLKPMLIEKGIYFHSIILDGLIKKPRLIHFLTDCLHRNIPMPLPLEKIFDLPEEEWMRRQRNEAMQTSIPSERNIHSFVTEWQKRAYLAQEKRKERIAQLRPERSP